MGNASDGELFTMISHEQHRAAGCNLSDKKREKFCKKSCKSKSSPKCKKRKNKLKKCCDKDCDCEDDNSGNIDVPALVDKCNELIGGSVSLPDIDVKREKRRLRKHAKIFETNSGRSYSFESRRGSGGIWGEWIKYTVVDGEFVTSLSDSDFFGFCSPVCKSWNMEDMFDAIRVGFGNFPSNELTLYLSIVLYDVKYSRKKGFPKHLVISPIQVIPEDPGEGGDGPPDSFVDPSRSVDVDGAMMGVKLVGENDPSMSSEKSDPNVFATKELAEGGGLINDKLVPGELGLSVVEEIELDTCQPLEIQVRRVKALESTFP